MKVLFDHQTFTIQRYGGISRYFANLHHGLNKLAGVNAKIALLYTENEYIKRLPFPFNNAFGRKLFTGHYNRIYRWNQRYCKRRIKSGSFDVFHPTYYDTYFLEYLKKPFVLTVHDMIHELFPKQFPDNDAVVARKQQLINAATAIIAISEHTKKDIIKFYPQVADKIKVIHHGYRFEAVEKQMASTAEKYILFIGERVSYKNFPLFVEAIAPLLNQDKTLKLVCAGGGRFNADEEALLSTLNIIAQCRQTNATDAELKQLYAQAQVFVFPSLIEGFGIPLLEAFSAGCPVAASNNTCFPEIGGDAIAYFDPTDKASIYDSVQQILSDHTIRHNYIQKGRERLKLFTIEKQVQQTLDLYREVAAK